MSQDLTVAEDTGSDWSAYVAALSMPSGASTQWTVESIARALDGLELVPWEQGSIAYEPARELEQAADRLGAERERMRALLVQADVQARQGQTVAAARVARQVNRWAFERSPHQRHVQARSHRLLASFFDRIGDFSAFLDHAMRAVELLDDESTLRVRIDHEMLLAIAQGRIPSLVEQARDRFAAIEAMTVELGRPDLQLATVNNVAYAEYQGGDLTRALDCANRLRDLYAEQRDEPYLTFLDTMAVIQVAAGRHQEAIATLAPISGGQPFTDATEPDALAECMLTLGTALRCNGDLEEAGATLTRCADLALARQLGGILVRVRREQAELSAAHGRYREAFEELKQYIEDVRAQTSAEVDSRAGVLQAVFDTERAQQETQRFRDLSLRDPLTGLYNRRHVDDQLPMLVQLHATAGEALSVAFVDLDHFKRVNDECSHAVGDEVLRMVADILVRVVGDDGFVARMGGEEFLLVLPGASTSAALARCEQVQEAIRSTDWTPVTGAVPVRASLGLACTSELAAASQAELLGQADRRVYAAKASGRDRIVW